MDNSATQRTEQDKILLVKQSQLLVEITVGRFCIDKGITTEELHCWSEQYKDDIARDKKHQRNLKLLPYLVLVIKKLTQILSKHMRNDFPDEEWGKEKVYKTVRMRVCNLILLLENGMEDDMDWVQFLCGTNIYSTFIYVRHDSSLIDSFYSLLQKSFS